MSPQLFQHFKQNRRQFLKITARNAAAIGIAEFMPYWLTIWFFPTQRNFDLIGKEEASIRAVKRKHVEFARMPPESRPEPDEIYRIATKTAHGNRTAAVEAFRAVGCALADVLSIAFSLIDGLVVIGGGLSSAAALFLAIVVEQLNSQFANSVNPTMCPLVQQMFNLEDPFQMQQFLAGDPHSIAVPLIGSAVVSVGASSRDLCLNGAFIVK